MIRNEIVKEFVDISANLDEGLAYRKFDERIRELIKLGWTADDLICHLELARRKDESSADELVLLMMDRVVGWTAPINNFFEE